MTYVKCRWDEDRGDQYASWGCSWWYLEFGPQGWITRQVEVYDSGVRLRYGPDHMGDTFGRLGEARRQDLDMPAPEEMTAEQFEDVWQSAKPPATGGSG
jgi:hypothetical protein